MSWFFNNPGRVYVLATLLPLAAFSLLILGGLVRTLARPHRRNSQTASFFYYLFGGDRPLRAGAYLATITIGLAAVLALAGLANYLHEFENHTEDFASHWSERTVWARLGPTDAATLKPAMQIELGYRVDHLTAILFAMVTVISTGIFLFSIGYMRDEADETVIDHEVRSQGAGVRGHESAGGHHGEHAAHHHDSEHLQRRGRYGRFFLFLSLFCFSMLNLLIADNLFQVFISWELVGVCSFLLVGFYYERLSASTAANKAFIVNRVGDAGFVVGMAIVWVYFGTFNFQDIQTRLRCPDTVSHRESTGDLADSIVRGNRPQEPGKADRLRVDPKGKEALIFPLVLGDSHDRTSRAGHLHAASLQPGKELRVREAPESVNDFTTIPYWLLIVAGLGVFLGCVGKSAQFPLHTWLPDAMEGPTPVSALIHAATMVAAGVYLVGRAYPLFTPEVLLVIAYTGAITLFLAASIALVQNDIKRVLAYSTVSQLGYMMLALGVGGWTPGLLHLLTHAFFKALLFLSAGAVIFGLHHEQDLRKMGGLRKKMPITAYAMLAGVLAIAGTPFFSGWYSKDQIISQALGFGMANPQHAILAVAPIAGAALTGFYMFRLWLLAFTGTPRDAHVHEHAHEAPWVMTLPLIVLALFSVGIAWGPEFWNAEGSKVGELLAEAQPHAVRYYFTPPHVNHLLAGGLALAAALAGAGLAIWIYGLNKFDPAALQAKLAPVHAFLMNKWYFDELYDAIFVVPTVRLAFFIGRFDKRSASPEEAEAADRRIDPSSIDGLLSALGLLLFALGLRLRALQTGLIRRYVLVLVLTTVMMFAILSILAI